MKDLVVKISRQESTLKYLGYVKFLLSSVMEKFPKVETNDSEGLLSLYEKMYRLKVSVDDMESEQKEWLSHFQKMASESVNENKVESHE